ncbi:MAG TPA: hypothetical protein VF559_11995 [Caulobacteraceae bacterium]
MEKGKLTVVTVILEDREDGGLRVSSKALPGLTLSGPDRGHVWECIAPAIKLLLERRGLHPVHIEAAEPFEDIMARTSPREVDMHVSEHSSEAEPRHVHEGQFVVQLAAA